MDRITKKDVIDFCYVIEGSKSYPLKKYLEDNDMEQLFCGVTNIPNARDNYALFYDQKAENCFGKNLSEEDKEHNKKIYKDKGETVGIGYKGITKTGIGTSVSESNQIRLSSIPKGEEYRVIINYNKDAYTSHCKKYKSYQTWLENRNESRYVDNKEHGQKYDGKNLMHCKRLLQIAREIAETGTVNIRRPNREELLDIRKGRVELGKLIEWAEKEMRELDVAFDNSSLPKEIDGELINELLIKIRTEFYLEEEVKNKYKKP